MARLRSLSLCYWLHAIAQVIQRTHVNPIQEKWGESGNLQNLKLVIILITTLLYT